MKRPILYVCLMLLIPILYFSKQAFGRQVFTSEYEVVWDTNAGNLAGMVESRLSQGYKLAGGVTYGDGRYMHAVYK